MKQLAPLLTLIVMLVGCATVPSQEELSRLDYGPSPARYEETIKKYFDGVLFDPYSAHYDFESPRQWYVKDSPLMGGQIFAGYLVRVGVNAKNRLGGYAGKKVYGFIINKEQIVKVMQPHELENMRTQ